MSLRIVSKDSRLRSKKLSSRLRGGGTGSNRGIGGRGVFFTSKSSSMIKKEGLRINDVRRFKSDEVFLLRVRVRGGGDKGFSVGTSEMTETLGLGCDRLGRGGGERLTRPSGDVSIGEEAWEVDGRGSRGGTTTPPPPIELLLIGCSCGFNSPTALITVCP